MLNKKLSVITVLFLLLALIFYVLAFFYPEGLYWRYAGIVFSLLASITIGYNLYLSLKKR
ncbi:hypothetical protein KDA_13420 [Dictyobacter alpinus]|uniref:Uncharacterized protein n=1 Tax=Dictyobacter alpinus TaxID=2014873 RepID=A0A402B3E7_9CHLR|nr:hypothetical protein KDA_13420 [Dictyobacter alpinus]